uniref:F-box domain-containing protein n=1 Tax=Caenorhabditis tropicalis TaxID=1561998 RepID=A0A1I7UIB7_9PELO
MTFPLLNLPSLAYEEVLLYLDIADLIDFSLLSSRCHRIIRSTRFLLTGIDVCISSYCNNLKFYGNTPEPIAEWEFFEKPWKLTSDAEIGWRQIGEMKIRTQKTPKWRSIQEHVNNFKVAFDYVQGLFRLPIARYWMWYKYQKLFPHEFRITKCDELYLSVSDEIPVDELNYVLEKMEISKKLGLYLKNKNNLMYGFVRFSMDELRVDRGFWITKETFLAMDCVRIDLAVQTNQNLPIQEFVSQWLSSKNTRFEWLKMYIVSGYIDWNDELKPMKWDPKVRGRNFKINRTRRVDCKNGIDFLRDDGMLATVVQEGFGIVYFIVWHKRFQPEADHLELDSV